MKLNLLTEMRNKVLSLILELCVSSTIQLRTLSLNLCKFEKKFVLMLIGAEPELCFLNGFPSLTNSRA
jgi:hypothetical protein